MHEFKINSLLWASLSVGRLSVYYWLSVSLGELFFTISQNWGHLSITRVATYQKVKNSLTFHWPLKSFHWSFINEKQSMLPFTLAFLGAINSFLFIFKLFLLCADRGRRNLQESIHNENHWSQLPHVSDVVSIDRFSCLAPYLLSFPKENAFQNLEEKLWTINRKTEFPDFSLTLTISKIFPDFLKISLTFPWPWKMFIFPWLFPDHGNPDYQQVKSPGFEG